MRATYQQWWERLTPVEQAHTAACVTADHVDAQMLAIFGRHGPIGVYGVRWAEGGDTTVLSGPFMSFVHLAVGAASRAGRGALTDPLGDDSPRKSEAGGTR